MVVKTSLTAVKLDERSILTTCFAGVQPLKFVLIIYFYIFQISHFLSCQKYVTKLSNCISDRKIIVNDK